MVTVGIDFGTSNTVAVLRWPDRRVRPLLFDGVPLLPSAVFVDDSQTLVGREALHAARIRPEAFEPNPKRRIDDGTVLLGSHELTTAQLFAAVLRRVLAEAIRVAPDLTSVTLTCPAAWGPRRRGVLVEAARLAGIPAPRLVDEPIAAASYFAEVQALRVPSGALAVVYDFGAGTFDASVVRNSPHGFEVLASEGLPDAGGLDVDAAIVRYFASLYADRDPTSWHRLEHPQNSTDRRVSRLLWDDVRAAKETLSRTSTTLIPIPLLDEDAPLGREQLEHLCRPILERTVAATQATLRTARVTAAAIAEVYLVGGSSRIPLAATLLHQALGVAPTAIEQPEMVVAEGSLFATTSTVSEQFDPPIAAVAVRGVSAVPPPQSPQAPPQSPQLPQAPPQSPQAPPQSPQVPPPSPVSPFPVSAPPAPGQVSPPPGSAAAAPSSAPPSINPPSASAAQAPPHISATPAPGQVSPPPGSAAAASPAWQPAPTPVSPPPAAAMHGMAPPSAATQPTAAPALYRKILGIGSAAVALVVIALIASSEWARALFGLGIRAPFAHPPIALIPAAVVLLLSVRRDPTPQRDLAVLARTGGLVIAGYALGLTLTLPLTLDVNNSATEQALAAACMVLGFVAGLGLIAFGVIRGIRTPPRAHRPVPALLAGAGFALSTLPDVNLGIHVPETVLSWTFRWAPVVDGIGRYLAFLVGLTVIVSIALLSVALLRTAGPLKDAAGSRGASIAGAVLLALGGAFVTYVSAVGLLAVLNINAVDNLDLARFFGSEPYSWFAKLLEGQATPWLALVALVALLVAAILRIRPDRRS